MTVPDNPYAYPSDADFEGWAQGIGSYVSIEPAKFPIAIHIKGKTVDLFPPTDEHIEQWWDAFGESPKYDRLWSWMLEEPWYRGKDHFKQTMKDYLTRPGHCFYAIVPKIDSEGREIPEGQRRALGRFSFIRPDLNSRVIELGHVTMAPSMKGTPCSTEAFYLVIKRALEGSTDEDQGPPFRRLEWKCHNANGPSKAAALRLGFQYEGLFRKAIIVKGRSRDTAWFSIIDDEWPQRKLEFETWLQDSNFEGAKQKKSLKQIREELRPKEETELKS